MMQILLRQLRQALPQEELSTLRFLLAETTGISASQQYLHDGRLTSTQEEALWAAVRRLQAGEPLGYVLGKVYFWDFAVRVTPATLIPRPDTEILIEAVMRYCKHPRKIIDLGTGSGIIALALARIFPQAEVLAIDTSEEALAVAIENGHSLGVKNICFQKGFWLEDVVSASADVVVSNPPYLAADDVHLPALQHEPQSALIADAAGYADLFAIIDDAERVLAKNGFLFLEHGYQQGEAVRQKLINQAWYEVQTIHDHGHHERVTLGKWGG